LRRKKYFERFFYLNQVFYNQAKNVRQIDVPTMSGNMGILGMSIKNK